VHAHSSALLQCKDHLGIMQYFSQIWYSKLVCKSKITVGLYW